MTFEKQFILELQELLRVKVPEIRFVDQNLGQWGNDNFKAAVSFPGLLIDFPNTGYSEIAGGDDLALNTIQFTLFFDINSQSYNLAPLAIRQKALDYYELEAKLVRVVKKWQTDYFTSLVRTTATSRNQNELGLRIRELNFVTEHEEYVEDETESEIVVVIDFNGQMQQTNQAD